MNDPVSLPRRSADLMADQSWRSSPLRAPSSPMRSDDFVLPKEEKRNASTLAGRIAQIFNKNVDSNSVSSVEPSEGSEVSEAPDPVAPQSNLEEQNSSLDFEEMVKSMEMKDPGGEVPSTLSGGVVLDQLYAVSPRELNSLLFSPESNFLKSFGELEGYTDLQIGPWNYENDGESLKRVVNYIKAPSKLIKALKAIEEHIYLKADVKAFAVLSSVSTPDAPYGKSFKVEVLYSITPGPEQSTGEPSSRLEISWRVNFLQSTMMRSMIEGGARQGIRDSFQQYGKLLSQNVKPLDLKDVGSEKDQLLASLEVEHHSDWKLAVQYFANFTVISTFLMGLYVLTHIWLAMPSTIQGLEFVGLDLPDSVGELIVCSVLVLQGKRVLEFVSRFMQARVQKGILI